MTTVNQKAAIITVGDFIRAFSSSYRFLVCDWQVVMSTGDGQTPDATKTIDGVHPNSLGITTMAAKLQPVLAAV